MARSALSASGIEADIEASMSEKTSRKRRRSYEAGHQPKFLVMADDSAECDRAVYFAARRAARISGSVVLLSVVEPGEFPNWLGVGNVIEAESEDAARATLERHAARVRALAGINPECVARTGVKADEMQAIIQEDEDIAYLVLAAGTGSDGPGPLVTLMFRTAASFPVPVIIVPGGLADEELDAMT
jgi:nucleotide-binding universal stress UspA family protein